MKMAERDLTADEAFAEAIRLSEQICELVGFVRDDNGKSFIGNVRPAVVCGALGMAAGRIMSIETDDDRFRDWLQAVYNERRKTIAVQLTSN